jgi:Flp pilus assembly protein TadD
MRGGVLKPELAAEEHYRRGRAHFDRKDFHSAAHLFREAVNLDATQGHYHYFLGVTLSVLSQARKAHNHDEGCHVTCKIGGALVRNQRVRREAEQHLLLAADLDRKNPEIRVRLGLLYKDAGMEKKAEQYFNEALMLDASNQIALRELGLSGDHIPRPEYE